MSYRLHVEFLCLALFSVIWMFLLLKLSRLFGHALRNYLFGAVGSAHVGYMLTLLIVGIVFGVILVLIEFDQYSKKSLSGFVTEAGPWLGLFGFIITVIGLIYSSLAMQDLRHIINTFEGFKTRFTALLEEAAKSRDRDNYVRIMAYTPLPGAFALKRKAYSSLKDKILDQETRVEIMCLDDASLREWMSKFVGKKARGPRCLSQQDIDAGIAEVDELLERVRSPSKTQHLAFAKEHPTRRGPIDKLPRFYAYFSNERAIVVNPLFFPLQHLPATAQPSTLKERSVEVIGFETTDTHTIENLHLAYNSIAEQLDADLSTHEFVLKQDGRTR